MNHGMVWTQVESPQICSNSSVKYPSFFENVPKINIGIKEVRIQSYRLLKMVNGKPNLSLSIKNASKIAPCNSKIRSSFDGFQVTSLIVYII